MPGNRLDDIDDHLRRRRTAEVAQFEAYASIRRRSGYQQVLNDLRQALYGCGLRSRFQLFQELAMVGCNKIDGLCVGRRCVCRECLDQVTAFLIL